MSNYADTIYGDEHFAARLNVGAWEDALESDKIKALTEATDIIDRLNFAGDKASEDQDNQFPRGTDTEVPNDIKKACCEIAFSLLDGVNPDIEFENLMKTSLGYGGVRTTFDRASSPDYIIAGVPSPIAWRILLPYLSDPRTVKIRRV